MKTVYFLWKSLAFGQKQMESFPFFSFFSPKKEKIICMCFGFPVPPGRWSWTSLVERWLRSSTAGIVLVGGHWGGQKGSCNTSMTLGDIRERNQLGHSLMSSYGISKFSLEEGGRMAKVSMKNNSEPHLPLIFLMWTKKFLSLENNYSKWNAFSFPCFIQSVHLRSWRDRAK